MLNFSFKLTKKQTLDLLIFLGLLLVLPLTLLLVKQRQEIRKRAAGSAEVDLRLDPSSGEKTQGESFGVEIKLLKLASREIKISGAEAVLEVDERLIIDSVSCGPSFDGLGVERVENQKITLMCTINIDTEPISLEKEPILMGTVSFSVKEEASLGEARVTFSETRVTEAGIPGQAPDVSTSGQDGSYTIVSSPTITPTPTPTAIVTPTQTPTPTPSCPDRALQGDYDCNGKVEEKDFEVWRDDYLKGQTTLSFFEYWRRAYFSSQ